MLTKEWVVATNNNIVSFYFISGILHKLLKILTVFKIGAVVPHLTQEDTEARGAGGKVICQSHKSQHR